MHFALQQSEGWQERAILLLQMLLECLIIEDWFLTVLGTRLCEWTLNVLAFCVYLDKKIGVLTVLLQ